MNTAVREARRVVLCDDHEIVREAIKARMSDSSVVEIVGEASNGRDVVDVVKELEPDVLIIFVIAIVIVIALALGWIAQGKK